MKTSNALLIALYSFTAAFFFSMLCGGDPFEVIFGFLRSFAGTVAAAHLIAGIILIFAEEKKKNISRNTICLVSNAILMGLSVIAIICDVGLNILFPDMRGALTIIIMLSTVPFSALFGGICLIKHYNEKEVTV